jgi:hypothetical protein
MSSLDSIPAGPRQTLHAILGLLSVQMAPMMGCTSDDVLQAMLSLVEQGLLVVAADRERFWIELTEEGWACVKPS